MTGLLIIPVVVILATAILMLREIQRAIPPSGWLLLGELGRIERDLRHLEDVVVILDKIERPYHMLLDAVIDNLRTNVKYHFFVASDHYHDSLEQFGPFFEKLIEVAATLTNARISKNDKLAFIYQLPFPRDDYPYIFYCFRNGGPDDTLVEKSMSIIGFRGCDHGRGIADQYYRLGPIEARSYLVHIFATAYHSGHAQLPSWLAHLGADEFPRPQTAEIIEFATQHTAKLLEHRPATVLNIAAVAEIEKLQSPQ
jgi:hypothetical protein